MDIDIDIPVVEVPDLSRQITLSSFKPRFNGNYSSVYQAIFQDQFVAVKVIKEIPGAVVHTIERKLKRERTTWALLRHPNILPLLGFANDHDLFEPFGALISPWRAQGNASVFLKDRGKELTKDQRLNMWKGVVEGVQYLHNHKPVLVHGDLKLANVMIDDQYSPQICDFGLVSIFLEEGHSGMTTTSQHTGTDRYLAYELVCDEDTVTPTVASDIFALGCIGLEFYFLQTPYANRRNNMQGRIFADIRAGIRPATPCVDYEPQCQLIWSLLGQCWQHNPSQRPSAGDLLAALQSRRDEAKLPGLGIEGRKLTRTMKNDNSSWRPPRSQSDLPDLAVRISNLPPVGKPMMSHHAGNELTQYIDREKILSVVMPSSPYAHGLPGSSYGPGQDSYSYRHAAIPTHPESASHLSTQSLVRSPHDNYWDWEQTGSGPPTNYAYNLSHELLSPTNTTPNTFSSAYIAPSQPPSRTLGALSSDRSNGRNQALSSVPYAPTHAFAKNAGYLSAQWSGSHSVGIASPTQSTMRHNSDTQQAKYKAQASGSSVLNRSYRSLSHAATNDSLQGDLMCAPLQQEIGNALLIQLEPDAERPRKPQGKLVYFKVVHAPETQMRILRLSRREQAIVLTDGGNTVKSQLRVLDTVEQYPPDDNNQRVWNEIMIISPSGNRTIEYYCKAIGCGSCVATFQQARQHFVSCHVAETCWGCPIEGCTHIGKYKRLDDLKHHHIAPFHGVDYRMS